MIELSEIKAQCRIEHDLEDDLLRAYSSAAIEHAQKVIDATIYQDKIPDGKDGVLFNNAIKIACLMLIAHWHANREAVAVVRGGGSVELPLAFGALLAPYRRLNV